MTTSSDPVDDAFAAFKRKHGLDDDWSVRFTADEFRAREMAKQYRESGHDVRVLPLSPDGEELDPESFDQFADAEHDPLRYVEMEDCGSCLSGTHVVLTKPQDVPDGSRNDQTDLDPLVYE